MAIVEGARRHGKTMTTIRITVGDQTNTAELADNATAQDLVQQLPLNLRFRDFNGVEKIAKLPRPLTMTEVPAGDVVHPATAGRVRGDGGTWGAVWIDAP
ncbi:MAG TPA: cyclophilin-like fold protein [Propionibacteriaceae bacterium]|nr:cyclophilin-like fold protein [Propionibacteriaceae bacterium]